MYSRSMLAASYGLWVSYDLQKATSAVQVAAEIGYRYEAMSASYASIFTAQMQSHYPYAGATVRYAVRDWFMPYTRATVGATIGLVQVSGSQSATLNATSPSVGGTLGLGALFQGRVGRVVGLFALLEGGGMAFSNAKVTLREDPPADPDVAAERIRTVPVQTGDTNVSGAYVRVAFGLSL